MPNPHNRKSFEAALAKVQLNDKLLTEAYAIADQEKFNDKQLREFLEILGGLAAGAAIAAPAIATGVGMYRKAQKEKQERQDALDAEKRARDERVAEADTARKHTSSEAELRRGHETSEAKLRREHETSEAKLRREHETGEANQQRKFTKRENKRSRKQEKKLAAQARKEARTNTVAKILTRPGLTPTGLSATEKALRAMGLIP